MLRATILDMQLAVKLGSEYLALRLEVNINVPPNARIELGSILAFDMRLY